MAEGETGWEDMIIESLIGEKRCFVGAVGDATNGYLLGHVWSKDEQEITDEEKEERQKWKYLYSEESYTVDVLADDMVTTNQIEICEPAQLKDAIDSNVPTSQGIYIGGKKYRALQVQSFPAKSYPDVNVKAIVIALDKVSGCIAIDGGYYVIALIDTKEVEQKNLAVELACDMAAYLTQMSNC